MEISVLNMYHRLRDYHVPVQVLDEIFSNESDLKTLSDSWKALEDDGLMGDEIAEEMSAVILEELEDDLVQSLSNDKKIIIFNILFNLYRQSPVIMNLR
jgi:uncharacterized protein YjgD (DUF1641 family)